MGKTHFPSCLPLLATCGETHRRDRGHDERPFLQGGSLLGRPEDEGGTEKVAILGRFGGFGGMGTGGKKDKTDGDDGSEEGGREELFSGSLEEGKQRRESSESTTTSDKQSARSCSDESEPLASHWDAYSCKDSDKEVAEMKRSNNLSEMEMMKERFAKLLLGEDMSGCGKGVPTALAISNAITNLCATIFGQVWRLEPLPPERKTMWRREIEWLLCVSDHIVELSPTWQTLADGSKLEVMTCRPRSDLYINLPALKKLDNMLLEILDSFEETEFWYIEQGILGPDGTGSFCKPLHRQEEKWWLPLPRVPSGGLQEKSRKHLEHKRESANQILKAVMAINSNTLAEMDVPESYLESLPKNGRASLGDLIHRYITSDQFSPDCLLDCLDLSSEHQALEIANRVEAVVFIWRRRPANRPPTNPNRTSSRSSWGMVKDFMGDGEKRELLADRAESLLMCLKQRFPCLTQTSLDTSKIQNNKDIGRAILESYSRVLESLAFNIVARIDDVLYVDNMARHSDKLAIVPAVGVIAHKRVSLSYSAPPSSSPYTTAYTTPSFSPAPLSSLKGGERSPLIHRRSNSRGFGVKKALTDYLGVDTKTKNGNGVGKTLEDQQGLFKIRTGEEGRNAVRSPPSFD